LSARRKTMQMFNVERYEYKTKKLKAMEVTG
jgi:hypothetical protein